MCFIVPDAGPGRLNHTATLCRAAPKEGHKEPFHT